MKQMIIDAGLKDHKVLVTKNNCKKLEEMYFSMQERIHDQHDEERKIKIYEYFINKYEVKKYNEHFPKHPLPTLKQYETQVIVFAHTNFKLQKRL